MLEERHEMADDLAALILLEEVEIPFQVFGGGGAIGFAVVLFEPGLQLVVQADQFDGLHALDPALDVFVEVAEKDVFGGENLARRDERRKLGDRRGPDEAGDELPVHRADIMADLRESGGDADPGAARGGD